VSLDSAGKISVCRKDFCTLDCNKYTMVLVFTSVWLRACIGISTTRFVGPKHPAVTVSR
jgi:hypothetical protein